MPVRHHVVAGRQGDEDQDKGDDEPCVLAEELRADDGKRKADAESGDEENEAAPEQLAAPSPPVGATSGASGPIAPFASSRTGVSSSDMSVPPHIPAGESRRPDRKGQAKIQSSQSLVARH